MAQDRPWNRGYSTGEGIGGILKQALIKLNLSEFKLNWAKFRERFTAAWIKTANPLTGDVVVDAVLRGV